MSSLSATDVARNFSDVLNRVNAGEEIDIVRNGVPIAHLGPPAVGQRVSARRWRDVMDDAPRVDDDFAADVARARAEIGPPKSSWPS